MGGKGSGRFSVNLTPEERHQHRLESVRRSHKKHYKKKVYSEKQCLCCKAIFKPKRKNSKFCSERCINKFYRDNHKIEARDWRRINVLGTTKIGNGYVRVKKREYKGICELCKRSADNTRTKKLDWHHWNDEHPEWGLWLDRSCHYAVEFLDEKSGIEIPKYRELKRRVENGETNLLL
jgi:hypothetical protein